MLTTSPGTQVAGKLMQTFNESVESDVRVHYSSEAPKANKKRTAVSEVHIACALRPTEMEASQPADDDEEINDSFVEGYYKNDKLNTVSGVAEKCNVKVH